MPQFNNYFNYPLMNSAGIARWDDSMSSAKECKVSIKIQNKVVGIIPGCLTSYSWQNYIIIYKLYSSNSKLTESSNTRIHKVQSIDQVYHFMWENNVVLHIMFLFLTQMNSADTNTFKTTHLWKGLEINRQPPGNIGYPLVDGEKREKLMAIA